MRNSIWLPIGESLVKGRLLRVTHQKSPTRGLSLHLSANIVIDASLPPDRNLPSTEASVLYFLFWTNTTTACFPGKADRNE